MKNYEYICNMTKEQLLDLFDNHHIDLTQCFCPAREICFHYENCDEAFLGWLDSEYNPNTFYDR